MGSSQAHMVISKDDFKALPPDDRDYIIYTTVNNVERRVSVLEKRKLIDKGVAVVTGFLGGIAGILGLKLGGID